MIFSPNEITAPVMVPVTYNVGFTREHETYDHVLVTPTRFVFAGVLLLQLYYFSAFRVSCPWFSAHLAGDKKNSEEAAWWRRIVWWRRRGSMAEQTPVRPGCSGPGPRWPGPCLVAADWAAYGTRRDRVFITISLCGHRCTNTARRRGVRAARPDHPGER